MFFMGPGKRMSKRKERALLKEFAPAPVILPILPPDYSDLHRLLIRTRYFLDGRWTRGSLATDHKGMTIDWVSPRAKNFCLVGGMFKTMSEIGYGDDDENVIREARRLLYKELGPPPNGKTISSSFALLSYPETIEAWNDRQQFQRPVLRHLDRVIAKLEKARLAERIQPEYSGC